MDRRALYNQFLEKFPIEKLGTMTLEEYTNLDRDNSFCYWLESRTSDLGSIFGGSSYKFGIYKFEKTPYPDNSKYAQDENYSWSSRLGATSQEAFENVRNAIVKIANHARKGEWAEIENVEELWPISVWKIAFLYSNAQLFPVFKLDMLRKVASGFGHKDPSKTKMSELQSFLVEQKGDKDLFDLYDRILNIIENANSKPMVWLIAPGENAYLWNEFQSSQTMRLGWDSIGDLSVFNKKEDLTKALQISNKSNNSFKNDSLALWQFAHKVNEGDIVYAKKGVSKILGRGVVQSDYYYDETLSAYKHVRKVNWTHIGDWESPSQLVQKTFTDISEYQNLVKMLDDMVVGGKEISGQGKESEIDSKLNKYLNLLKSNHNLIFTGAPGTGKTYLAKQIAEAMGATEENGNVKMVQFHPSYDYTDFVEGLRPKKDGDGFERVDGVFKSFCAKALSTTKTNNFEDSNEEKYIFIIDEINRGELSKIFGELFFSIDPGYRGEKGKVETQYQNMVEVGDPFYKGFYVPENVYIIGTMNDIDRGVESMDFAIRRRFAWEEITAEDSAEMLDRIPELAEQAKKSMNALNEAISKEAKLSSAYHIGPAYYLKLKNYLNENDPFACLWDYHIRGVIFEYLRGTRDAETKLEELKKGFDKYNEE